jgi:hypothetical protein
MMHVDDLLQLRLESLTLRVLRPALRSHRFARFLLVWLLMGILDPISSRFTRIYAAFTRFSGPTNYYAELATRESEAAGFKSPIGVVTPARSI